MSRTVGGRRTEFPAPVIQGVAVYGADDRTDGRRWHGIVDTGAEVTILPTEIGQSLGLLSLGHRVRVSSYRKDEPAQERLVYHVKLGFPDGTVVATHAILAERRTILIGRSALQRMRLMIDWPANSWSLEEATLPKVPGPT